MSEIKPKKQVTLYTDGACSGNPGPGGWGCILSFQGKTKEMSGFMADTTNNRMEIFAVISGLAEKRMEEQQKRAGREHGSLEAAFADHQTEKA